MSDEWYIQPNGPLIGDVEVYGSKNAVTKHMVAAILGNGPSTISNVPEVGDVQITADILRAVGAGVTQEDGRLEITPPEQAKPEVPLSFTGLNRIPVLMLGPLLHLTGEAFVPMDECLARCVVDFSGRPHLVWRGLDHFSQRNISAADKTQDASSAFRFGLAREFFQGFTNEARCNLHLELLYGDEPHHIVEGLFKAFARAVDAACQQDPRIAGQLPSTKGKL